MRSSSNCVHAAQPGIFPGLRNGAWGVEDMHTTRAHCKHPAPPVAPALHRVGSMHLLRSQTETRGRYACRVQLIPRSVRWCRMIHSDGAPNFGKELSIRQFGI